VITFLAFAITTCAGAFLYKAEVWTHDQLRASWRSTRKNWPHKRASHAFSPSCPKDQFYSYS